MTLSTIATIMILSLTTRTICGFGVPTIYHNLSTLSRFSTTPTIRPESNGNCKDSRSSFLFRKFDSRDEHVTIEKRNIKTQLYGSSSDSGSDDLKQYENKNNIRDQVVSALSTNGQIKVTACSIRNLLNDVSMQLTLSPVPTDALGRSMTCSLLLSNGMQAEQMFQLTLNTDGPIRGVVAISTGKGELKGYVGNPGIGEMPLVEAVGKGTVQVVKNHPDWPRPYNGITGIRHGDIDRDVGIYLAESEQRSCALAAATSMNGILCTSAGGYIVEQLPGCDSETIAIVERNLSKLIAKDGGNTVPSGILLDGGTPIDICSTVLDGLGMKVLGQLEPSLKCDCSEDRLLRAVRLLPSDEVEEILRVEKKIEARCHFCGKVYRMTPENFQKKLADAPKGDPALDENFQG